MTLHKLKILKESGIFNIQGLARFAGINPANLLKALEREQPELRVNESKDLEDSINQALGDIGARVTFQSQDAFLLELDANVPPTPGG